MRIRSIRYGSWTFVTLMACGLPVACSDASTAQTPPTSEPDASGKGGTDAKADVVSDVQRADAHPDAQDAAGPLLDGLDSPFGCHPASIGPTSSFVEAQNIGIRWHRPSLYALWFVVQPDLDSDVYDFKQNDRIFGAVPKGIRVMGNISPDIPVRTPHDRFVGESYIPVDEAKYVAFVKATVERYDGDGTDDMPGLASPVTYWQVSNEPHLEPGDAGTFADLERITYTAIKDACADCKVVMGGTAGFPKAYISGKFGFDKVYGPIFGKLQGKYADIFDFHWYGAERDYLLQESDTGEDVYAHVRSSLTAAGFFKDMPIWITEMGSYSGHPPSNPAFGDLPAQTERQQARDLFKRYIYPLSRGVEKVFLAFGLMEGFVQDDNYFNHTGLIYDGKDPGDLGKGVRKLGYYTYQKMTQRLEGADWSTLTTEQDPKQADHVFVGRLTRGGETIRVVWWDTFNEPAYKDGDTKYVHLSGLKGPKLEVSSVVPSAQLGKDVPSGGPAFQTTYVDVDNHEAVVEVGGDPVIVTESF